MVENDRWILISEKVELNRGSYITFRRFTRVSQATWFSIHPAMHMYVGTTVQPREVRRVSGVCVLCGLPEVAGDNAIQHSIE